MSTKRLLSTALVLSVFTITAQGQIENGGFETGDFTSWWTWDPCGSPYQSETVQTAVVHNGTYSAKIDSNTPGYVGYEYDAKVGQGAYQYGDVPEKYIFTLSFAYNTNDVNALGNDVNAMVEIRYADSDWSYFDWEEIYLPDTNGTWATYDNNFVTPADTAYAEVVLRAGGVTTAYFDDVNIVMVGPLTDQADVVFPEDEGFVTEEDQDNCGHGPALQWERAPAADGNHHLYFGMTFEDVNDANTSDPNYVGEFPPDTNFYTLDLNDIEKSQQYFWRVDETVDGNVVKAQNVWSFWVWNLTWVDNFDSYGSDANLQAVWGPNALESSGTMQINYDSTDYEVGADTSGLLCSTDVSENAMLVVLVRGHQDMNDGIYVVLESNGGAQSGTVQYPDVNELDQRSYESFRTWLIDLQEFVSQGVDLTNVTEIRVGVGSGSGPAGSGTVSIDDIRFDYPYCDEGDLTAELIPGDFDDNCWVGMQELGMLVDDWLATSYTVTAAAPSTGPILWYEMEEGSDSTVGDSSGNNYWGVLNISGAWVSGGGVNDSNCLNLGNQAWVDMPIQVNNDHNTIAAESTVSWWMKDPGQSDDDSMLMQIGNNDYGIAVEVWTGATGSFYYKSGYNPVTGDTDALNIGSENYTNPDHPQDEWVHYAFVKSFSNGYIRAYRNGQLIAEGPAEVSGAVTLDATNSYASLGAWRWVGDIDGYYDGLVDDFRIYDYALSQAEVLYLAVQGGAATSPLTQGLITPTDATGDDLVNLADMARMAEFWLQEVVWP